MKTLNIKPKKIRNAISIKNDSKYRKTGGHFKMLCQISGKYATKVGMFKKQFNRGNEDKTQWKLFTNYKTLQSIRN